MGKEVVGRGRGGRKKKGWVGGGRGGGGAVELNTKKAKASFYLMMSSLGHH